MSRPEPPDGYAFQYCDWCEGMGTQNGPYGGPKCTSCGGSGLSLQLYKLPDPLCPTCNGRGRVAPPDAQGEDK